MTTEQIKAMVRRFSEEPWNTGNLSVFGEVCDPRYILYHPDGTVDHLHGIKQAIQAWRAAMPDLQSRTNDIIINGDYIAFSWTMTGTEDGQPRKMIGISFLRLKNGKIIEDRYVVNEVEPVKLA